MQSSEIREERGTGAETEAAAETQQTAASFTDSDEPRGLSKAGRKGKKREYEQTMTRDQARDDDSMCTCGRVMASAFSGWIFAFLLSLLTGSQKLAMSALVSLDWLFQRYPHHIIGFHERCLVALWGCSEVLGIQGSV